MSERPTKRQTWRVPVDPERGGDLRGPEQHSEFPFRLLGFQRRIHVNLRVATEQIERRRLTELAGSDEEAEGVGGQGAGVTMPPLGVAPVRAGGTEE